MGPQMGMKQKVHEEKSRLHQLLFFDLRFVTMDGELVAAWSGDIAYRRLYSAGVSGFMPSFHIPRRAALKKRRIRDVFEK